MVGQAIEITSGEFPVTAQLTGRVAFTTATMGSSKTLSLVFKISPCLVGNTEFEVDFSFYPDCSIRPSVVIFN